MSCVVILQLAYCVLYFGLNFILRGGQEHRGLKIFQLNVRTVPDPEDPARTTTCVEYRKHGSKN